MTTVERARKIELNRLNSWKSKKPQTLNPAAVLSNHNTTEARNLKAPMEQCVEYMLSSPMMESLRLMLTRIANQEGEQNNCGKKWELGSPATAGPSAKLLHKPSWKWRRKTDAKQIQPPKHRTGENNVNVKILEADGGVILMEGEAISKWRLWSSV